MAERLWSGEVTTSSREGHPFAPMNQVQEISEHVAFYKTWSNITAVATGEGLVLIDTGSFHPVAQQRCHEKIRGWNADPLHTAIYTHGHVDHAYGLPIFLDESEEKGWTRPQIVSHEAVIARMKRYIETAPYNEIINARQFGHAIQWPTDPVYPTVTYGEQLSLQIGEEEFQLFHAKGETDDHTWVFIPGERVLCTGDLFIWAVPNAGNPQKVQRYCSEWCRALRKMAALKPRVLLPGHGVPIEGEERVESALLDTAEYLESLYRSTVDLMNAGATIHDLIEQVRPPAHLLDKPYLQPVYDEPEFIIRNIHRCLGGWYSGVPSELKPAPLREQAGEIAELAGGIEKLVARGTELMERDELRLACHLLDWAAQAEPDNKEVHRLRARIYRIRAEAETSTMAKGIFNAAAVDSEKKAAENEKSNPETENIR